MSAKPLPFLGRIHPFHEKRRVVILLAESYSLAGFFFLLAALLRGNQLLEEDGTVNQNVKYFRQIFEKKSHFCKRQMPDR